MANKKVTRRALVMSVVALILCCAMLVGTTFAWFTDSASSAVNTIQSGNLDVDLVDAEGNTVVGQSLKFVKAASAPEDEEILWEPGCTYELEPVYVKNNGNLALKYQLTVNGFNGDLKLLEALEWSINGTTMAADGLIFNGNLEAQEEDLDEIIIKAHMKEDAGNEFQGLTLSGIGITVQATQDTVEYDSYGKDYDAGATFVTGPTARVTATGAKRVMSTVGMGGAAESLDLDVSFQFATTETKEQAAAGDYAKWHADFVVKADRDVAGDSMALAGYYAAFCEGYNNNNWVSLQSSEAIPANTEIRLLAMLLNGGSMNYAELCEWVPTFDCGAADLDGSNVGTTLTVELRLFEIDETASNQSSIDCETGNSILVGTYTYTFK